MKEYLKYLQNLNYLNYLQRPAILGIAVAAVIIIGSGFFIYSKSQSPKVLGQTNQKAVQEEVKKLVLEVGKLIDLPTGEDPTIATVTDITKLKDQPFFAKAQNGDKVLIYTNARKAILYDPKAHKVIDVAPINIGAQPDQIPKAKVVLRNGTETLGLTTRVETELKKSIPSLNIVTRENAGRNNYEKSEIVVLNDSGKDLANNLSKILKADIVPLASDEAKPKDADVLVILGKDRI